MSKALRIFIGRQELIGYTDVTLSRDKTDMTGQLEVQIFMGYMPNEEILGGIIRGEEILVYIAEQLVFSGIIDRRKDTGTTSLDISGDTYTVRVSARGKTKVLIDSSHQSNTTLLDQTDRSAIEELVAPWGIVVDWQAAEFDLGRVRLLDGSTVFEEITRIAEATGLYVYENRDGSLRVTDASETAQGEALVLGQNILAFSTDQLGDIERNQILVKGQLTTPTDFGADAVLPTLQRVADAAARTFSPVTVQVYGNATPELIDRAALYEANKQASLSKQIEVEVFHIQQTSGDIWDLGVLHYVEIPPAGVAGVFETVKTVYSVTPDGMLKTRLTLAPSQVAVAPVNAGILSDVQLPDTTFLNIGATPGLSALTASWGGAQLTNIANAVELVASRLLQDVQDANLNVPPLRIPPSNRGDDDL